MTGTDMENSRADAAEERSYEMARIYEWRKGDRLVGLYERAGSSGESYIIKVDGVTREECGCIGDAYRAYNAAIRAAA